MLLKQLWNGHEKDSVSDNTELFELRELIRMYKKGQDIKGKIRCNPHIHNQYVHALLIIRNSKYPITAKNVSKKCDISSYKVRQLYYEGLAEIARRGPDHRHRYVDSETGEGLLMGLNLPPSLLVPEGDA